jgi:hypothetical protein
VIGIALRLSFWCRVEVRSARADDVCCRSRSDHLLQLQHDIATYFGYNTFLVGKLMKLFPLDEVSSHFSSNRVSLTRSRPLPSLRQTSRRAR